MTSRCERTFSAMRPVIDAGAPFSQNRKTVDPRLSRSAVVSISRRRFRPILPYSTLDTDTRTIQHPVECGTGTIAFFIVEASDKPADHATPPRTGLPWSLPAAPVHTVQTSAPMRP